MLEATDRRTLIEACAAQNVHWVNLRNLRAENGEETRTSKDRVTFSPDTLRTISANWYHPREHFNTACETLAKAAQNQAVPWGDLRLHPKPREPYTEILSRLTELVCALGAAHLWELHNDAGTYFTERRNDLIKSKLDEMELFLQEWEKIGPTFADPRARIPGTPELIAETIRSWQRTLENTKKRLLAKLGKRRVDDEHRRVHPARAALTAIFWRLFYLTNLDFYR